MGEEITKVLFGRLGEAGWSNLTEETLLNAVQNVFVKRRNRMINRLKLHGCVQGPDQPVQQFVANLKQIARTCCYNVQCSADGCDTAIDYSNEMVLDQLIRGLNDDDIQKKVLSTKEEDFNLDAIEKVIISEECSKATQRDSKSTLPSEQFAPISAYKRNKRNFQKPNGIKGCLNCGLEGHKSWKELPMDNKSQCKANGKTFFKCGKMNQLQSVCQSPPAENPTDKTANQNMLSLMTMHAKHQINSMAFDARSRRRFIGHIRYDKSKDKFVSTSLRQNNSLTVDIKFDGESYKALGGDQLPKGAIDRVNVEAVADTGAALCCTPVEEASKMGVKAQMFQSSLCLYAADRRKLNIHHFCKETRWVKIGCQRNIVFCRGTSKNIFVKGRIDRTWFNYTTVSYDCQCNNQ